MPPATLKEAAKPACLFETDVGAGLLVWADSGELTQLSFGYPSVQQLTQRQADGLEFVGARETPKEFQNLVRRIQRFLSGKPVDFQDVPLRLAEMSPFRLRVTQECRRLGRGETISYGELAARAGSPRAARAVGSIMARNPFPLIVPCHRVVGGNSLGGFSSPTGLQMKRYLLRLEQVEFVDL